MKKYLIIAVIISVLTVLTFGLANAIPAKLAYKTNNEYLNYKSSYTEIIKTKYMDKINSFTENRAELIITKIDSLINKYEESKTIDNRERLKKLAILEALKDVIQNNLSNNTKNEVVVVNNTSDDSVYELGDGKISTYPKAGYIYSCVTRFGGGGAWKDGEWIDGNNWNPDEKNIQVSGSVKWEGDISITISGNKRIISGNGVPDSHTTGTFPVSRNDDAYNYDRNPNSIEKYSLYYSLPANPTISSTPSCVGMGTIGVSVTGVAIFNGLDAVGRDAVAHEIQDNCDGHPERDGRYHYHNVGKCLDKSVSSPTDGSAKLVGYALDGFGIYGNLENGKNLTNADLDECHGHTHEIIWDGVKKNIFHYHATPNYPYIIGCYKGGSVR